MMRIATRWSALMGTVMAAALLSGCEKPPMNSTQNGYRGTAMGQVSNPRLVEPIKAAQKLPEPVAAIPSPPGTPLARDTFKNVKVLGDLDVNEFTRTMLAITAWVSPKEGCNYCHVPGADLSEDTLYTKSVARKMLEMTRGINAGWKTHVSTTGVTCYTCHRGQPVPAGIWFNQPGPRHAGGASAESDGHNAVSVQAGLTAIDVNVLSRHLVGNDPLRAAGKAALPAGNRATIQQTENIFGLMIHASESLGVNCTFCHNTRSHAEWADSPVQRTTAYHGIRMVRELNNGYMVPLTSSFPAARRGQMGDVAKVGCATCHQGQNKPLGGAPLVKDHPALATLALAPAAAPVPVPAAATTPVAVSGGKLGSVYFASAKSVIDAAGTKAIADAAAALKADGKLGVSLSGFADRSGNADANLELAKQRAFAVRDALQGAGVEPSRIVLKKPEFVIGGGDGESRRVDINAMP